MPSKFNCVIVTVIGADTVGIIAKVPAVLAAANAKGEEMGLRIDAQHEDVFKFIPRVCG